MTGTLFSLADLGSEATTFAQGILDKAADTSVVSKLSPSTPQLFMTTNYQRFTNDVEAEFVEEGANKASQKLTFDTVQSVRKKAQVTLRFTQEAEFADKDQRRGMLIAMQKKMSVALGRALDYAVLHGLNPVTKKPLTGVTGLVSTANKATATKDAVKDVDALPNAIVNARYVPNAIALDPKYANTLRQIRGGSENARVFPEINLDPRQTSNVAGYTAGVSGTVSAEGLKLEAPTNVLAVMGDFSLVKWGIVRDMALKRIDYGDPDGQGDLQRTNEFAVRVECIYQWAVLDPKAFTVLKSA